ncbi:hybrid sensor histidine kinase/response regulator [Desulfofustis glycolicus]|uniref:histidine kinase n=1 Tax=Desulfofustis glycolicus DSM 9705 TaxID=1121409 RepID=A0A1M5SIN4_9BACT|nr:PAS domain-containing sensor histidine kinase [Desulfofustis glycolicus]MCB2215789.1 response regulator [Desulfobulbaceae bacterium]SHH38325.1 PAS domain S-box-containing protein [Desulfofustis glycolicus DSM 9705]
MALPHSNSRSSIKTAVLRWTGILAALFIAFVFYYQDYVLDKAVRRIDNHARVVTSSLWTFDRSGPLAYLRLAAEANGYLTITVYDESDSVFLTLQGPPLTKTERLLNSLHLLPVHDLDTNIVYEDGVIGRIVTQWPNRSVYLYLNIFFWLALVLVGITLLLSLIDAKHSLEDRVKERTVALENEIAERKKTEEALRDQTQRLKLHVMNTPLAVIEWNIDFEVVEWNRAAEYIFEYRREEALGKVGYDFMLPDTEKNHVEDVWKQLTSNTGGYRSVNLNLTKYGTVKTCEWYNTTLTNRAGDIIGVASLVLDITERKRAEAENERLQAQLLQAQKMEAVGNLAGGIAHDFNNILQTISGNTGLLLIDNPADARHHARLQAIERAVRRAAELVRQLLTFSRKINSDLKPLDLNQEIRQIRGILAHTMPKMIAMDLQLDDDLPLIRGDSVQVEQVLLNLAINAMHAMIDGGTLTIRTNSVMLDESFCRKHLGAEAGPYAQLSITDTGAGIAKEALEHIFEPFFTTKSIGQGTGLGLSIVYGIVKSHQAFLECYSTPGSGTEFQFFFPALPETAAGLETPAEAEEMRGGTETILLIDDEEAIREIGREILSTFSYTVFCADSGEAGLEAYFGERAGTIDLVILDLNMPGMGGFACLQKLREKDPESRIVIASGYTPTDVINRAMDHGARSVIAKPFQLAELLRSVRTVLDGH